MEHERIERNGEKWLSRPWALKHGLARVNQLIVILLLKIFSISIIDNILKYEKTLTLITTLHEVIKATLWNSKNLHTWKKFIFLLNFNFTDL